MKKILIIAVVFVCIIAFGLAIHANQDTLKGSDLILQNAQALAEAIEDNAAHCCSRKPGSEFCPKRSEKRKWVMYIVFDSDACYECEEDDADCED